MLDATLKAQLKAYLERLASPIEIVAYTDAGEKSVEMKSLLQEIAALTPSITLLDGETQGERLPSFAVRKPGEAARVRFAGLPLGHEFTSLVLALLQVSGYPPKVEQSVIDRVKSLSGELRFETYVSLTCHNCPEVVQALNLMAVLNPKVQHVMVEGSWFQEEIDARQIMGVPAIYLNGEVFGQGRMQIEDILAKLSTDDSAEAAALNAKAPYDVLVVGGGPAGGAAAVYAARKGIRTGLVAERFGGQVQDTLGIENFISVLETEGPKLAAALEAHVRHYEVDLMNAQRAVALKADDGAGIGIELANGATLRAKSVILANGAKWRNMNVPGEAEYRTKGVTYCPHCDGPFFKGKRVAVIGGGNSGVEAAIDLAGIVDHVTLLEFGETLRADAVLQTKLRSFANVDIIAQAQTTEVLGDGKKVTGLRYTDRASGNSQDLALEGIFVQIGLLPSTDWLKGSGVELSARGEIIVDDHGQTSMPGVFAAGDATTVPYKQIIIAMGEGAKAALSAFDFLIRH